MSKFTQPARSVRDIKTLADKAEDRHAPHKMYMRLFSLETERHRRLQERTSAMLRVETIDARCAQIAEEMDQLRQLLGMDGSAPMGPAVDPRPTKDPVSMPASAKAWTGGGRPGRRTSSVGPSVGETVKIRY